MKHQIVWKESGQPYSDDLFDSPELAIAEIGRIEEDALALSGKLEVKNEPDRN